MNFNKGSERTFTATSKILFRGLLGIEDIMNKSEKGQIMTILQRSGMGNTKNAKNYQGSCILISMNSMIVLSSVLPILLYHSTPIYLSATVTPQRHAPSSIPIINSILPLLPLFPSPTFPLPLSPTYPPVPKSPPLVS